MSDKSEFVIPNTQPVVQLDCDNVFNGLASREKHYAHYLSQAAWYGSLATVVQISPESPAIFQLLHRLFQQPAAELKKIAVEECNCSEDDFLALLVYTCSFFANSGNYKGMGDTKFVPDLDCDKLESIIKKSAAYQRQSDVVGELWDNCKEDLFSLKEGNKQLGFSQKGITTYFSKNCTSEDAQVVSRFMKFKKMDVYNNRVFKTIGSDGKVKYEIRLASSLTDLDPEITSDVITHDGCDFVVTRGDYSPVMKIVADYLDKAKEFASNENEKKMLENYVKSFTTGSLDAHKDGSRFWIKNKGPVIECYIGFIETYRDPAGMRGEFEGFVSLVNKEQSTKFSELVKQATDFLPRLPWPTEYEKNVFLRPDFTSLDVLTFSGSGIPVGINIPNYDEIRQNEGFKNVSLGNVITGSVKDTEIPFLSDEDVQLMLKYRIESIEVQVGLHELLGHGSGKLFKKRKDGTYNFDTKTKHTETGEQINKWYEEGETYDSKFSSLGSTYEECRAECVGLYLSLEDDILKIFGCTDDTADDVVYVNWLSLLWNGMGKALEMYQPKTESWLQAHSQARFVILRVLLETADGLVTVKPMVGDDGKDDIRLTLDRTKLRTSGKTAIGNFLRKLQVYKSTGDVESATKLYNHYSKVEDSGDHLWAKWRDIVIANKKPRKIFVQSNTFLKDSEVVLKSYESSPEGFIASVAERFQDHQMYDILQKLYQKDKEHFH